MANRDLIAGTNITLDATVANELTVNGAGSLDAFDTDGWADNRQWFSAARGTGTTEPNWQNMGNGQFAYNFTAGEELFANYHVNHDYAVGSNAYPHIHFLVDSTMTAGQQITWSFNYVIAKGHSQGESLTVPETTITMTYTATGTEVAGEHLILECSDLDAFPLKEPDTIIMSRVRLVSENVTGSIYGLMCDLHYQMDRHATINKAPNFYGG